MHIKQTIYMAAMFGCVMAVSAGIFIDSERDAIVVTDYPPYAPCTLARLAVVDRVFGWGRVEYDAESGVCRIAGDLIIGANDGSETVLRIGTAQQPRETLIIKGNIYVHPYFVQGENQFDRYWKAPKRMNALILGDESDNSIQAALEFDCSPTDNFTLFCGYLPWKPPGVVQWGGGLYVYNSRIAPRHARPGYEIGDGARGMYMGATVLDNAVISGVKGMLYGMGMATHTPDLKDYLIRDTIFENIEIPIACGAHKLQGCKFISCGTAIMDRGSLDVELTDCVFENNERNWSLMYTDRGLTLIDCRWDSPRKDNVYRMHINRAGKKQYPKLRVVRHIVVEVTDGAGRPVPDAMVSSRQEQDNHHILPTVRCMTDIHGRTPASGHSNAILLTEYIKVATDQPNEPELTEFTYTIKVEKDGHQSVITAIRPDISGKIIKVNLAI